MIGARKGGRVGARPVGGGHGRMNKTFPCGRGHGRMNKTIPCGGVPLWGYFSMWAVFSLHVDAIFSVCCGGYVWSDIWTSHVIYNCHHQRSGLPPPPNFFCWNPYNCYHIFFTSQIFIFLPDSGGFNFFKEVIFFFS